MKAQAVLISLLVVFFYGCGSQKVTQKSRKIVVTDYPIDGTNGGTPQIESSKKRRLNITPKNTQDYINKFAPIAVRKMKEHRIPASITLAQGILESGSGRSNLAIRSNNHFGIKCHRGWEGKSVTHDDDKKGECFRKYKHPEGSYEDHSTFLKSRSRYAKLFRLKPTDYKGWAYGLKRAGYATDPRYPRKLINLIKKYNLHQYDYAKSSNTSRGKRYKVVKGDTLYSIARRHNTNVNTIKKLNGLVDNTISIGQELLIN